MHPFEMTISMTMITVGVHRFRVQRFRVTFLSLSLLAGQPC